MYLFGSTKSFGWNGFPPDPSFRSSIASGPETSGLGSDSLFFPVRSKPTGIELYSSSSPNEMEKKTSYDIC